MPVNWANFLAGTDPVTEKKSSVEHLSNSGAPVDASITYPNGTRNLVAQIVQKAFPQYVNRINTKVTADMPENGSVASYGGLKGDSINLGKVGSDLKTYTYKGKPVTGSFGADSNDIMEDVGIALHELYHGRQAVNKNATPNSSKLGKDWKNLLADAKSAGFPSIGSGVTGGDDLEELLATAVPITQMREQGMTPTGRFKDIPAALDGLTKKYPWLPAYVKEQSNPEDMKPAPNSLDTAVSFLTSILGK